MSQIENYKLLLEKIFDKEVFFTNLKVKNRCIDTLNNNDKSNVFKKNFIDRLIRLKEYFADQPFVISEIFNTAKEIGSKEGYKWSGKYSELVALDYWTQFKHISNVKFGDNGLVNDFPNSIAKQIGKDKVDIDLSFDVGTNRIFTDVKSFIPTHAELIDQIISKVKSRTKDKNYSIGIDNIFELDFMRILNDYEHELNSGILVDSLVHCINKKQEIYKHKLKSKQLLTFRIKYNEFLWTIRQICPYRLALDYKYKILKYYNKLLIDQSSLITFVINPWFNNELIPKSNDFLLTFCRALSRRVFIDLNRDQKFMQEFDSEFDNKNYKISDISNLVSGIVFIFDYSVNKIEDKIYDTFIYLNPNAKNKMLTRKDFDILSWSNIKQPFIDDFYFDNY